MTASAVQTIWCELIASTLADAGVTTVVISPGSRSTPLVTALAREPRIDRVTIIDERAAAFFALGAARATHQPVALVCTSGTAGAHYLPAIIEASLANIPLIAITADRPAELLDCGASQTIDQVHMYGRFVRHAFDLGAPVGTEPALRGVRRKLAQAITLSLGPLPGPVHLEVPLRKPLEPIVPTTDGDIALAAYAHSLRGTLPIAPPTLAPDAVALADLAAAISAEPDGIIVAGALPTSFAGDALLALAERAGYPILAEAGSQLRGKLGTVPYFDLIPVAQRPTPKLVIQLGAEPVAASWPQWNLSRAQRWVLAPTWADPTSSARVVVGDVTATLDGLLARIADRSAPLASFSDEPRRPSTPRIRTSAWLDTWRELDRRATAAIEQALAEHPHSESAAIRAALAALPPDAIVQVGNSLPIRVIDQVTRAIDAPVITQRGAAGIDGLIASAAGATCAGHPVLLVLGDVSFAHDVGGLLATRAAKAPLAILVVDNGGGQIFAGLPVSKAGIDLAEHWLTAPAIDPVAVATALGVRAVLARDITSTVGDALAHAGVTVIHAPVSATGAHDVRRAALERMEHHDQPQPTRTTRTDAFPDLDPPRGLRGHPLRDVP